MHFHYFRLIKFCTKIPGGYTICLRMKKLYRSAPAPTQYQVCLIIFRGKMHMPTVSIDLLTLLKSFSKSNVHWMPIFRTTGPRQQELTMALAFRSTNTLILTNCLQPFLSALNPLGAQLIASPPSTHFSWALLQSSQPHVF